MLKTVDPRLVSPLRRSRTGHLLLDLCTNWLKGGAKILYSTAVLEPSSEEKVFAVESEDEFHAPTTCSSSPICLSTLRATSHVYPISVTYPKPADIFPVFEDEWVELEVTEGLVSFDLACDELDSSRMDSSVQDQSELSMSLRLLALLATTSFSSLHDGSLQGQVQGFEADPRPSGGHDGVWSLHGGHDQIRSGAGHRARSSRSSSPREAMPGLSRPSQGRARLSDREQRLGDVGRLQPVQVAPSLRASLRGSCSQPVSRGSAVRRDGDREPVGGGRELCFGASGQGRGLGSSREVDDPALGYHPGPTQGLGQERSKERGAASAPQPGFLESCYGGDFRTVRPGRREVTDLPPESDLEVADPISEVHGATLLLEPSERAYLHTAHLSVQRDMYDALSACASDDAAGMDFME